MVRVVLDTNVIVSAGLKSNGNERRVLETIRLSGSTMAVSPQLLAEYRRVIERRKFAAVVTELRALLAVVRREALIVRPVRIPVVSRDPGDNDVLACAEAGSADYIVTGNLRDFPQSWRGTRIVNARVFLQEVTR